MAPDTSNTEPGPRNPEPGTHRFEVIDAFVDGRSVDPPELKRALAETEGRDYFIDAWLLRESLQAQMALESLPQTPPRARSRREWLLPMAVSLAFLIGGGLAGYRLAELADRAPAGNTQPAPIPSGPASSSPSAFPVPAPTRAIPFEFSSDSSIASGDN